MLKDQFIHALGKNLSCNFARLKCLSLLISAILRHRTVNLTILATTPDGKSCTTDSRYRRFQDFFKNFSLCLSSTAKCILAKIPKPPQGYVLAMDRTNWQFGCSDINFLAIAIVVGKVSIPIVWKVLSRKNRGGNSNAKQRIELMKKLLKVMPAADIRVLTMDREFHGKEWLSWLDENGVGYVLRIKKNTVVGNRLSGEHAASRGRKPISRQKIFGLNLYYGCKKMKTSGKDTHLMVVSNRFDAKEACKLYRLRWGIERLFGHLKKKGFDLEATHMTDASKLEKLFAIVTLAFTYSFAWGCHLRHTKQKDNAASKRKSLFRLGMENILNLLQEKETDSPETSRYRKFKKWLKGPSFNEIFLV